MTFDGRLPLMEDEQKIKCINKKTCPSWSCIQRLHYPALRHFFWGGCKKISSLLVVFHKWLSSIKGPLPSKGVFYQRLSSIKGRLPSKVVFHQRSSSIKSRLPSKGVFHQKSSSIKGHLPSNGVFHQRSSSIEGRLPSKVVFHQRSSSTKGCLPSPVDLILSVAQLSSAIHNLPAAADTLPSSSLSTPMNP